MTLSEQIAAYLKHAEGSHADENTLRVWADVLGGFEKWVGENSRPLCVYCGQENRGDAVAASVCPLNPHGRHHVFKGGQR